MWKRYVVPVLLLVCFVSATHAANIIKNPGFESGSSGSSNWFQASSDGYPVIAIISRQGHNGSNGLAVLGAGNNVTALIYQDITLPADTSSATLDFYYQVQTKETTTTDIKDLLVVRITDPPTSTAPVNTGIASNLDYTVGSNNWNLTASNVWKHYSGLDLTAYKGKTIQVALGAITDSSNGTMFLVDDINLDVVTGAGNGSCGGSNGATFTVAPSTDFCSTGTASTLTGSGPWYWSCNGNNGGTTASCSAYFVASTSTGSSKAKVYLGTDDTFTVSSSGTTVYGGTGSDSVAIAADATGVILDQNVERINFFGASNSFAFKQTGNKINIYNTTGVTLLATAPVQGDADGTLLSFSDGTASALLAGGVMTLGGAPVNATTPTTLTLALTANSAATATATKAKVYLGADDTFTVSSSGTTLYGGAGNDTVTITSGVAGVILDQNVERINVSGTANSYAFKQTGNKINVYDAAGSTLLVTAPVQGDSDGTVLGFSNGAASALLSGGVMTLGGVTVSSVTAGGLSPTLK